MTDETNVAEAANDTATPAVEAQPEANEAPATSEGQEASSGDLRSVMADAYKRMNSPEQPEAEAKAEAEDATVEGEETPPEGGEENTDQPSGEEGGPSEETTIAVPSSWSKEMAELWPTMDPKVQEYVLHRDKEQAREIQNRAAEIKRMEPIVSIAQRYQQNFDRHGVSFEQGMESLMGAQAMLDQNPLQGIAAIAQTYGIDLPKAFGPTAEQMDPALKQLIESNRALQAQVQNSQRDQRAQQAAADRAAEEQANSVVNDWLGKVDRPYFDKVEAAMTALIQTGQAADLDSAYDMACYANPEIRQELTDLQKAKDEAARQKQAQVEQLEKARAAKEAKRLESVNGGNRASVQAPMGDWRETLRASAKAAMSG